MLISVSPNSPSPEKLNVITSSSLTMYGPPSKATVNNTLTPN